jgi:hypothetical protein
MNAFAKAVVQKMEEFPRDLRIPLLTINCKFTEFHKILRRYEKQAVALTV